MRYQELGSCSGSMEADTLSDMDQELIAELFDSLEMAHNHLATVQWTNGETIPHIKTDTADVGPQSQHQTTNTVKNCKPVWRWSQ